MITLAALCTVAWMSHGTVVEVSASDRRTLAVAVLLTRERMPVDPGSPLFVSASPPAPQDPCQPPDPSHDISTVTAGGYYHGAQGISLYDMDGAWIEHEKHKRGE